MHGSTNMGLLLIVAAATLGCGDEAKKATVSNATSWQIGCVPDTIGCGSSRDAHRADNDAVKLNVTCTRDETGLNIELEDPGQEPVSVDVKARSYSKLVLSRLSPSANRCSVRIEEEERGTGGTLRVLGQCGDDADDACTVTGEVDTDDGWAFDGEIACSGLRQNGEGEPLFTLQKAGSRDPMVLQIANCK